MTSVHSSASSVSAIAVDPRTSQNSIVTTRRSPERSRSSAASGSRRAPHELQNLAASGLEEPHAGHASMT
jgi:hypothetical protein